MSAYFTPTSILGELPFLTGAGTCQYAIPRLVGPLYLKLAVENCDCTQNLCPIRSMDSDTSTVIWLVCSLTLRVVLFWPSARWSVESESA